MSVDTKDFHSGCQTESMPGVSFTQLMCKRHRFAAPWPILVAPLVGSRGLQLVCAHGAAHAKGFLVRGGRTGSQVSSGGLTPKTFYGLQYDAALVFLSCNLRLSSRSHAKDVSHGERRLAFLHF